MPFYADILRECRGDNKRLIAYLCRPEIVRALVALSITPSPQSTVSRSSAVESATVTPNGEEKTDASAGNEPDSTASPADSSETSTSAAADAAPPADEESVTEDGAASLGDSTSAVAQTNPMKYPYVASELLSADIRELCDVVVEDDSVMDLIFACVENNEPGCLDPFVASHFSKVIVSLLKTRNAQTLKQMERRNQTFTNSLIKHIALGPISELIVRLLDAPEHERSYDHTIHPPTPEAISLLSGADLLNKLSESFVRASSPTSESETSTERRHREETLSNVTATMTGLTERILQLPPLNVPIPEQLSPYHTPYAISRLLDAGLEAVTSGKVADNSEKETSSPTAVSIQASSVVLSGNYSALLHSLGISANLMTTKGNIWEEDKSLYDPLNSDSTVDGDHGVEGTDNTLGAFGEEPQAVVSDLIRPRNPGENIVSTSLLEQELALRFERLAEMFGSLESDASSKLPLGSLRLKLAEFFTACMKKASRATVERSIELGVPKKLLDLFRRYEWSSMLHGVVTASIISALESGMSGLPARIAWFQAQLVPWLLSAWSSNEKNEAEEACRFRAGYMGHLIKIGAALRIYVSETESMNREALLQLISEENLGKFKKFAEDSLGPAHQIEVTPLCDNDSESEEVYEEDTVDLLDAGVGEVIEGLTQGDPGVAIQRFSKFLLHKSGGNIKDEEEDIQTVDVGDLSHFPDDDIDVQEVNVDIDHDLPTEMREQLRAESAAASSSKEKQSEKSVSGEANGIGAKPDDYDGDDDGTYESHIASKKSAANVATSVEADPVVNDFKESAQIVDSRKGASKVTMPAHVDTLASDFKESVRIVEPLSIGDAEAHDVIVPIPSPSLEVDAAVTEIDEPQPVTPNVTPLQPRTGQEALDESSDEDEFGDWVDFSVYDRQQQQQGAGVATAVPNATSKTNVESTSAPAVVKVKEDDAVVPVTKAEVARPKPVESAMSDS